VQLATPLDKITRQARRAGEIVHGIRAFVKKREPKLARVAADDLLNHTLMLAGPMLTQHRVNLHTHCDEALYLDADRVLLEQVLLNLVNNAVEAMRDAGTARPSLQLDARRDGKRLRITVADNGPGLSDSVAEQLFTPFFTTKQEGMGIGLNICRSIIEYHRGEFGHYPNPDGGCVFWVSLPLLA
jgi:C4-dicarboxylate-specific signal transduction histidine kinase